MQSSGGGLGGHGQEVCWAVVDGEVLGKEYDEVSMCARVHMVYVCGRGGVEGVYKNLDACLCV
jgi:hypothetical protein